MQEFTKMYDGQIVNPQNLWDEKIIKSGVKLFSPLISIWSRYK